MIHFLNGFPKLFWCDCSAVWWCSESNPSHTSDNLCQSFTKGFVWLIIIYNHRYKLNRIDTMDISRFPYLPLSKLYFLLLKYVETSKNIFKDGVRTTNFPYHINWDPQIFVVFLGIVVCGILFILSGIFEIGLTKDKNRGMWRILKRKSGIYHDQYTFGLSVSTLILYNEKPPNFYKNEPFH